MWMTLWISRESTVPSMNIFSNHLAVTRVLPRLSNHRSHVQHQIFEIRSEIEFVREFFLHQNASPIESLSTLKPASFALLFPRTQTPLLYEIPRGRPPISGANDGLMYEHRLQPACQFIVIQDAAPTPLLHAHDPSIEEDRQQK